MHRTAGFRFTAFIQGFAKGLGATVSSGYEPRHPAPARIEIDTLHRSILDPTDAMRSDWMQVGADINAAIEKKRRAA